MTKKNWISVQLINQAKVEDAETADRMITTANHLSKCGSSTIWDVANRGWRKRLQTDSGAKEPNIDEFVEVSGSGESVEHSLSVSGLARCKRIQCPLCCYTRSLSRRSLALDWAQDYDWSGYYGVLLTFTVPHRLVDSDNRKSFLKVLNKLSDSMKRFSGWFRGISCSLKDGYLSADPDSLGYVSALEFTFGANGLHPHFHTVFLTKCEKDIDKVREFFMRDRVRIWKESGNSLLRMPDINESKSFEVFLYPSDKLAIEKVVNYVSKGLFETLSSETKSEQKSKTSKSIFELTGHELKYFCTFFESTSGKRFYRAGGICKEITKEKETIGSSKVDETIKSIIRISTKEEQTPEGWVSEFVAKYQKEIQQMVPQMTSVAIKKMVTERWEKYRIWKQLGTELGLGSGRFGS
jgi:hypothetical protein